MQKDGNLGGLGWADYKSGSLASTDMERQRGRALPLFVVCLCFTSFGLMPRAGKRMSAEGEKSKSEGEREGTALAAAQSPKKKSTTYTMPLGGGQWCLIGKWGELGKEDVGAGGAGMGCSGSCTPRAAHSCTATRRAVGVANKGGDSDDPG